MSDLIFPPGRVPGCLPRQSVFGELAGCPALADRIKVIPQSEWQSLIDGGAGVKEYSKDTLDQDAVGSCASEAGGQILMTCRGWENQARIVINPWSIYPFVNGGHDGGSTIEDNLEHIRDVGALPMEIWPRSKGWNTKPPDELLDKVAVHFRLHEFYDIGSIEEAGTALVENYAVQFGWDGHSVMATSLKTPTVLDYHNSWGVGWGNNGFGELALRRVHFGYGMYAARSVVDGSEYVARREEYLALARRLCEKFPDYTPQEIAASARASRMAHGLPV